MVQAAGVNRDQVREELIALAHHHIDRWDEYADREFRSNEFGFEFVSHQTNYNNCTLTVSKASVPGLTLEKHKHFRENIVSLLPKMDDRLTIVPCPDHDGLKCFIQHIKMPVLMTNRSIPILYYSMVHEDGSLVFIGSSHSTDAVVANQASIIKKNVVANNIINYTKLTPTADGCDWVSVQCLDIAGSIPDALKKQGAERQAKNAMNLIKLIRDGDL